MATGFNWDNFSPDLQQNAMYDASNGQTLHMAENAGQKAAAYCLRAKEKVDAQVDKIRDLEVVKGFGEDVPLDTGRAVADQYKSVAASLREALTALSAEYQGFADRFVATEMAIRAVESNNTQALKGQQLSIDPHAPSMQ
ncbi:hypothetical protein [Mycobacterium sp. NPDC050853]|uniref:hypothetical protein n=1 Tax=Mycobacterium sp. NPDC050853 TaxID=3155160 RepID=UPI0033F9AB24